MMLPLVYETTNYHKLQGTYLGRWLYLLERGFTLPLPMLGLEKC